MIHVRHGEGSELTGARRRLEERPELLKQGTPSVVWAILDKVVDDYYPVAQGIEDDIEEVEAQVFGEGDQPTERIYFLKREVIEFHRAVGPLLVPLETLEAGGVSGRSTTSCGASSATSPTTPAASTSRSTRSASF